MNALTETATSKPLDLAELRTNPESYFEGDEISFEDLEQAILAENDAFRADLSTDKGRKAISSFARQCSTLKTALDGAGKQKVAVIKKQATAIDARRKSLRDFLDAQRDTRRKPLDDWEEQEQARVASHRAIIEDMIQTGCVGFNESSESIQKRIDKVTAIDASKAAMQEFSETAAAKKTSILENLSTHLKQAKHNEEQALKLKQLEEEKAEQERIAKEEREKREAAEAQRKREDDERLAAEQKKAEEERIEREKEEAVAKARRKAEEKAEQKRLEQIRKQEAEEEAKRKADEDRAADIKHRKAINNKALAAIMEAAGIGEDRAKKIVTAIASGSIPHVSIKY